jgi:alkylation response protein AidB-like acyl-CoA dehydrogenase
MSLKIASDLSALCELAAGDADEAEAAGRLTEPVVEALRDAGVAGLGLPPSLGGEAAPPHQTVAVLEQVGRADGSAGWVAMIAATTAVISAYLPPDEAARIWAGGPRAIVGGVYAPKGVATPAEGGYTISGTWPFGSGCLHADWLAGGVIIDGSPRLAFFPSSEVTVHPTWEVIGLSATGSHDFAVEDSTVPASRIVDVRAGRLYVDLPLYRFPIFGLLASGIAGVCLGIAGGALDAFVALALEKTPTGARRTLAARASTQEGVAKAATALGAARRYLLAVLEDLWAKAAAGDSLDPSDRARLRLAATHAVEEAARVTTDLYRMAGGTAVYRSAPLERRLRDVHTATQHMMVGRPTWELGGRVLLGIDDHPEL